MDAVTTIHSHQRLSRLVGRHPHLLPGAAVRSAAPPATPVRLVVPGTRETVEEDKRPRPYLCRCARLCSPVVDRRYRLDRCHTVPGARRGRIRKILRREQPDLIEICEVPVVLFRGAPAQDAGRRPALVGLSCERMDDNVSGVRRRHAGGRRFAPLVHAGRFYSPQFDVAHRELRTTQQPNWCRTTPVTRARSSCGTWASTPWRSPKVRARPPRAASRRRLELGLCRNEPLLFYAGRLSAREARAAAAGHDARAAAVAGTARHRRRRSAAPEMERGLPPTSPVASTSSTTSRRRGDARRLMTDVDLFVHPESSRALRHRAAGSHGGRGHPSSPRLRGCATYAGHDNAWLAGPGGARPRGCGAHRPGRPRRSANAGVSARCARRRIQWSLVTGAFFDLYDDLVTSASATRLSWRMSREATDVDPDRRGARRRAEQPTAVRSA